MTLEGHSCDCENIEKGVDIRMSKRILVTGANGYIGKHIVQELLNQNFEVLAADVSFDGMDERVIKIEHNIFSEDEDIYEKMGKPDACIHMAWRNGFVHNADSHIEDLPKHFKFIKNMTEGGLKQIAVMGTMHEVGYHEGAISEDTPTRPLSMYAIAKNALRQMCEVHFKDSDIVFQWIRGYYIYGDDARSNSIFSKIVHAAEEGKKTFPFTMGKNKYDFIHVDEMARQIAAIISQTEVTGIINSCTGNPMTLAEKIESFIKEHQFDIKLEYGAFPDRPYDSPGVWGDTSKIDKIMESVTE